MSPNQTAFVAPATIEKPQEEDRIIGSGSFGVVWNIFYPRNGTRVALKRVKRVFKSQRTALMVFRELKMLCTFQHENVLAALEVLQPFSVRRFDDVYIVTELMHTDLRRLIRSEIQLSEETIKMFLYQILRGLKYIHSAKVIHRDIKPGNILVSDQGALKICDFGMARAEEPNNYERMSLNVVTRSYKAPELLLETKHYTAAIDIWATACVFAELLGREVLFKPRSPRIQLRQMIELLGTPPMSDIEYASGFMKTYIAKLPSKPSKICSLYDLSPNASSDAVDLLSQMLRFNPTRRISAEEALDHPYMDDGRDLYHSLLCSCCKTTAMELEPVASEIFEDRWEEISSERDAREMIDRFIKEQHSPDREPLCINPASEVFKKVGGDDSSTCRGDGEVYVCDAS